MLGPRLSTAECTEDFAGENRGRRNQATTTSGANIGHRLHNPFYNSAIHWMRSLHGNTQGLKPNQLRRIEKLYQRRIPPRQILTPEFARQLSELSHETNRQIGALIDRKGYVEYVIVGDARRIELPDFKRVRTAGDRFRGLRCVHTHLRGEDLTRDDLTDLALLRLDLIAAIDVDERTGLPGKVRAAHLLPLSAKDGGANGAAKQFGF